MMKGSALKVENLTVHQRAVPVLWDINFEIPKKTLVGIVGPNGAGKSTLIKAILGLVPAVSGSVWLLENPISKVRSRIAYVPQREVIDWDFPITVKQLVSMGRYPHLGMLRWIKKSDLEAVDNVLEQVGMLDLAERQISQLSGGQQQRAFLARALLQDPDIYFLDEPLAGVDHTSEELIMQILQSKVDAHKTVLMVHHDLNSIEKYFSWVLLLNVRLVACGPTHTTFTHHNIKQAYGKNFALLDDAMKRTHSLHQGMSE
jgi:manganese/zinc/iron transport system ATP- binding protein